MTVQKTLEATRGATFRFHVYLIGVDASDYTTTLQIRENSAVYGEGALKIELTVGDGVVVTGSTTVPAPDGRTAGLLAYTITADQMASLEDSVYSWGVETDNHIADVDVPFRGKFVVLDNPVSSNP